MLEYITILSITFLDIDKGRVQRRDEDEDVTGLTWLALSKGSLNI